MGEAGGIFFLIMAVTVIAALGVVAWIWSGEDPFKEDTPSSRGLD